MKDDMFFFAVAAVAIAAQVAVSSPRTGGQPGAAAAAAAAWPTDALADPKIRLIQPVAVIARRSDGDFPADQMARVEHNDR